MKAVLLFGDCSPLLPIILLNRKDFFALAFALYYILMFKYDKSNYNIKNRCICRVYITTWKSANEMIGGNELAYLL